ncbi:ATP-binding protein [Halorubrum sp. SP9]|uniref:ATP-binding protein n=1 Tax=Halorubrum sp. SP9 TaxID=1537267 RepID=UPI0034E0B061
MTINADPSLCRYAIEQLVENAVEHSEGTPPRVEITASVNETSVELVIADNGPGIPQTELDVIESAVLNSDLISCYHGVEGRSRGNRFCPWKSISSTSLSSVVA